MLFDELFGRSAGVDGPFGLLVDIFAGQFGRDGLRRLGIAAAIGDVECVCDVVAAGIDLDLNLLAYLINDQFHWFAAPALFLVEIVFLHQWLQRAPTGDYLRDTGELAGQGFFGDCRHD